MVFHNTLIRIRFPLLLFVLINFIQANGLSTKDSTECKIGLVLSAGGALGLAHIGVLKVFEENQIPVSFITGTSMGALIGGAYAAGYTAAEIESIALSLDWSKILKPTKPFGTLYLPEREKNKQYIVEIRHKNFKPLLPGGIVPLQNLEFFLMELFAEPSYNANYNFDSLPLPYRAIAVDLTSGKKVALKSNRLDRAIRGSIAIPGIFSSVRIDSLELIDGGVQQYLPAEEILVFKPDFLIGVLTTKKVSESENSVIDIISRTMNMLSAENLKKQKEYLDVIIEPDLERFTASDFSKIKEIINAGEVAALRALPQIKEKLKYKEIVKNERKNKVAKHSIIRSIRIDGLVTTREGVVNRIIKTKPGEYLDFKKLIKDLRRIYDTGLFDQVNYDLKFIKNDSVDIVILVHEPFYGIYRFGIRYDNLDGLATGFEIGQSNLFGTGGGISLTLHLGNPNEIKIAAGGTRFFLFPLNYYINGFWGVRTHQLYRENQWVTDYSIVYRGGGIGLGYCLGIHSFFTAGIKVQQVIYNTPPIPWSDSIPKSEMLTYPFLSMEFNNLDDFYVPTSGTIIFLDSRCSDSRMKSESSFVKINVSLAQYLKMHRFVLKYGIDVGLENGGMPWAEYFHSGGDNFIGFDKDEFVSRERLILNSGIDYKIFELFNRSDYPAYLGICFNIGKFNSNILQSKWKESLDYGAGIGLRANTPIGPINVTFGSGNFARQRENLKFYTYISIGRDFRKTGLVF
ncbi:MAG: patatin-like phospholipase family protein [candidate division WOR-3 bacterium]